MDRNLRFRAAYVNEKEIFFSAEDFNGLFRKGHGAKYAEFLMEFANEKSYQHIIHRKAFIEGDELIFFPFLGNSIVIYNTRNKENEYINIDFIQAAEGYFSVLPYGDHYIMIPWGLRGSVLSYFPKNKILKRENELSEIINSRLGRLGNYPACNAYGACIFENHLFISAYGTNKMLSLCLHTYETKEISINDYKINNIIVLDEEIWITCSDSEQIVKRSFSGQETVYHLPSKVKCDKPWGHFVPFQGSLLLLPDQGEEVWIYDRQTGKWNIWLDLSFNPFFKLTSKGCPLFLDYQYVRDELYLFPSCGNDVGMLHIKPTERTIEVIPIKMEKSFLPKMEQILKEEKSVWMWDALFRGEIVVEDTKIGVDLPGMFARLSGNVRNKNSEEKKRAVKRNEKIYFWCKGDSSRTI